MRGAAGAILKPGMSELQKSDFDKISPTAFITSLARQFTGIPYSKELAGLVTEQRVKNLPLILESRYRAVNRAAAGFPITQILELASGFLPRGLEFSSDPAITFIESDLPEMIRHKELLIQKMGEERSNLHYAEIDAAARPNRIPGKIREFFKAKQPVMILCEGLLMYLSKDEKKELCLNVRETLEHYGGVWITPDFSTTIGLNQSVKNNPALQQRMDSLKNLTGRSLPENAFETIEEAREFVKNAGFQIREYEMINVIDELSCIEILNLDIEFVKNVLNKQSVFILSL